ncbi:MAG: thiamine pyrophosphate-dependent enzyme, partial [Candidatus Aminicenantes bacterium]|nr:thiamine pyrophosphate-dependent enzyme [Candidatus Aminicenantes bacterium]
LVTRLSHSRSLVATRAARPQNGIHYGRAKDWTLLPSNARVRFKELLVRQPGISEYAATAPWNRLRLHEDGRKLGVIVSGVAVNYFHEAVEGLPQVPSFLKVGVYPLPEALVRRLVDDVDEVLVVEEGYPFIEKGLRGLYGLCGKPLHGKLDGTLPATGELDPDLVRAALGQGTVGAKAAGGFPLPGRPPQLCAGCPHADTLKALTKSLEGFEKSNVFSDIGCYTLGALPPYNAVQTCVCMGASVSMAKGGAEAGVYPSVAVIGDSTFAHSGITPLLSAATANTDMTVIILDNGTVAMTGGQPSFGTGEGLLRLVEGCGVAKDHIRTIEPLPRNHGRNVEVLREELSYHGLSVVVAVRECLVEGRKKRS